MTFSVDSQYCSVLKGVQPLVKAQNTSISASQKNQTVSFSLFNSDTNILVFHQVNNQEVEKSQRFAVFTDRLVSLIHDRKTKIKIDFDGSALNYKYRNSTGRVETHQHDAHERPQIQKDKTLTNLARKYFNLLSLKTVVENTEGFIFIEEQENFTKLIVSDSGGYHAVMIKIPIKNDSTTNLAIPLNYIQNALRILKENIQICNDEEHLYCYTKEEHSVSIIRFRNMVNTGNITSQVVSDAIESKNEFVFSATGEMFDDILKDYKIIEDPERGGTITVTLKDRRILLMAETRHGTSQSTPAIKVSSKINAKFNLPTKVLPDILRLKGPVEMGMKEDKNIFFISQTDPNTKMEVTYICTAERVTDEKH